MGLLDGLGKLLAGGSTIKGTLEGAGTLAKDVRTAITGIDSEKQMDLQAKLMEVEAAILRAQTEINAAEAKHASLFVSGWRPFIGWICASALGLHYLVYPIILWVGELFGRTLHLPAVDIENLDPLVISLLGLALYRTAEKVAGAQNRH